MISHRIIEKNGFKKAFNLGRWVGGLLMLVTVGFVVWPQPTQSATGINEQINFQARLLNAQGATVPDGNYNIEFKIYQDGDGVLGGGDETLKWTEDWLNNNSQGVTVKNGYFSVNLGKVTAFASNINWNQDTLWLSINIGNTNASCTPFSGCSGDGEMTPFKRFTSNPYALNSGRLGGLSSTQFVQLAQGAQTDSSTSNPSIYINKTGTTANILQLQRGGNDVVTLANDGTVAFRNNADSTTALQIQSRTTNDVLFKADTTNNRIIVGNATASAGSDSTLFVVDAATTANLPTGVNGGLVYDSTTSKFKIYENGAYKTLCNTTDLGCATGGAVTLQNAYTGGATINTADATDIAITLANTSTDANLTINAACSPGVNCSGSGGRFAVQTGGSDVFGVAPGGAVTQKTSTNSTTALQVQNSSGDQLLNLDTSTTPNLITNPSFETDTTGWAAKGSPTTFTRDTAEKFIGNASLKVVTTSTPNQGAKYVTTLTDNPPTPYTFSVYIKDVNTTSNLKIGYAFDGSDETTYSCSTLFLGAVSTGMERMTCTFTPTSHSGTPYLFVVSKDSAVRTFNIDGVQLETAASATAFKLGAISLNGIINSPAIFKSASNSVSAFDVQNAAGTSLFNVDTSTSSTGDGAVSLGSGADVYIGSTGTTTAASAVNIATTSSGTSTQAVSIGSNAKSTNTIDIDAGTAASAIQIGDTATAHGIKIGTGAAVQTLSIGSTNGASVTTINAGSGNAILNATAGTVTIQTTTSGQINLKPASTDNITIGTSDTTGTLLVLDTDTDTTEQTEIDGAMYYNSSLRGFRCGEAGIWMDCGGFTAAEVATTAPTVTSTAAETAFARTAATDQTYTLPANFCQPGRVLKIHAQGFWRVASATTPTVAFRLRLDSASGTLLGATPDITAGSGVTDQVWYIDANITCKTNGASGKVDSQGWYVVSTTGNSTFSQGQFVAATPPADITVDTTASHLVNVTADYNASSSTNTATLRNFTITASGP